MYVIYNNCMNAIIDFVEYGYEIKLEKDKAADPVLK